MRSFAIAALVGTVTASPAYTFTAGEAPHCKVLANGATAIEYTSDMHPSFKCTHTGSTCVCSNPHPTHHTGSCKEFDHTDGTNLKADGDCTDSGLNAIDGAWSGYTYGICSKSCGTGTQSMTRACDSPAPFNGGADCAGSTSTSQNCNTHACPVNGGWSGYTTGTCSSHCGAGTQSLTRSCNSPSVANGGVACAGSTSTSQVCPHTNDCPKCENSLVKFGNNFIQIGSWRFGDYNGEHFSMSSSDGTTAQIYRNDGTLHPGPRTDYTSWNNNAPTCRYPNFPDL